MDFICCSTWANSHELLGELVGVERIERVLVFQLRRQQLQEGREVAGDLGVVERVRNRMPTLLPVVEVRA